MKHYVVYCRGLLRYEGSEQDHCDYTMNNGRPTFHSKLNSSDKVTIFVYESVGQSSSLPRDLWDKAVLVERRDYDCLDTEAGQPMKAKSRYLTTF